MSTDQAQDSPLYQPLDTIRLLQMPWGKGTSSNDGELRRFFISDCPRFVALSYVWGSDKHLKTLNVNGHAKEITRNLHSFLITVPNIAEFSPDTWWWIDAICINQDDEKEKSSQMAIMGKIYESAAQTVVWLGEKVDMSFGEEARDCSHAISSLKLLCDKRTELASSDDRAAARAAMRPLREKDSGVDWRAVRSLMLRPWWRRVWTLQEFLISNRKRLRFYCGKKSISKHDLERAVYGGWLCEGMDEKLLGKEAHEAGWNRRRMSQWYDQRTDEMGLIAMLAYVGDSGVTKAEDRIYSLLGIAKDAHMFGPIASGTSVRFVYTNLVKDFVHPEGYNSLDVICYTHLFHHEATNLEKIDELPSWVPDWRAHVEGKVVPVMASQGASRGTGNFRPTWFSDAEVAYKASGTAEPEISIDQHDNILTCKGIVIDTIDGLGGSKYDDAGEATTHLPLHQPDSKLTLEQLPLSRMSTITEVICRCLVLDREDRYLSQPMPAEIFNEHLLQFCKAYFNKPTLSKAQIQFREWFDTNKDLIIGGQTLEEHCREASRDTVAPKSKLFEEYESPLQNFHKRVEDTVGTMARRLAITKRGYLGMAANRARKGDCVCVLFGCSIPVLLRRKGKDTFELVGECYLDGFMNGEALEESRGFVSRDFQIV